MAETTDWGFPKGLVAQTIRKILSPQLTDHEVEAIVVCLLAHLLVEYKLNRVLYQWLRQDAPVSSKDEGAAKAEDELLEHIVKMDFVKKWKFVKPFFEIRFPRDAKQPWKLNDLRNHIFHGRPIKDAKFYDQPISDEKTVENILLTAQRLSENFDKFEEMVDAPHARAERWRKHLEKLGEPQ